MGSPLLAYSIRMGTTWEALILLAQYHFPISHFSLPSTHHMPYFIIFPLWVHMTTRSTRLYYSPSHCPHVWVGPRTLPWRLMHLKKKIKAYHGHIQKSIIPQNEKDSQNNILVHGQKTNMSSAPYHYGHHPGSYAPLAPMSAPNIIKEPMHVLNPRGQWTALS